MSAANCNSNSYDSGRITYTSRGKARQSAGSISAKRYDFLDFLGVAQSMRTHFLPIRWLPGLIGKGGTAEIRQRVVNIEKTFAFKQMKKTQSPMEEAQYLCALIAEVSILNQYRIRTHKNIVNIEGLCWEVVPGEEKVWPVLVFEKAPYGDLHEFMSFSIGGELNIEKRLGILIDVALAIRDIHSLGGSRPLSFSPIRLSPIGVIHGDIKPENVLIFPRIQDLTKWSSATCRC
jgi:serine/threonine protein kinase